MQGSFTDTSDSFVEIQGSCAQEDGGDYIYVCACMNMHMCVYVCICIYICHQQSVSVTSAKVTFADKQGSFADT